MQSIELNHVLGARARVFHHGAHVTSWKTADGVERLFLSERSQLQLGVAIRGGVPIIFPQFATRGPLTRHGFARTAPWRAEPVTASASQAVFHLSDSPATAMWPYAFAARYDVSLGDKSLIMSLTVNNTGATPFSFTAALHTYLRVHDVERIRIAGLQNCRYRDSANGNVERDEVHPFVTIHGEVDRIYFSGQRPITVHNPELGDVLCAAEGFTDTVIWNPGKTLTAGMSDMVPGGYRHMICVEAAVVEQPVQLAAGHTWTGVQRLTLI